MLDSCGLRQLLEKYKQNFNVSECFEIFLAQNGESFTYISEVVVLLYRCCLYTGVISKALMLYKKVMVEDNLLWNYFSTQCTAADRPLTALF